MLNNVADSMEFEGMTSPQALTLMNAFLKKVQSLHHTGLLMEFGTYKGRATALMAKNLNEGNWLHAIEQSDYLEFDRLLAISSRVTWHKQSSETFVTDLVPVLAQEKKIIYTHHDASHYFNNVYAELSKILEYMDNYGIAILDDFSDVYSQVRAAYYYLRYKHNFPYELLLIGFNKAILVREDLFEFWEEYVLSELLDDMAKGDFSCKLHRTDINRNSRSFYLNTRKQDEDAYYGLKIWGNRFYQKSSQFLKK